MNFTSPFPKVRHDVFGYTFLEGVALDVFFWQTDGLTDYWKRFERFAKSEFDLDIPADPKPGNSEIASNTTETKFVFNYETSSASVLLGRKGYKSFDDSMRKRIDTLGRFLENVAETSTIKRFMLRKANVFPLYYKEGKLCIKDIMDYVFRAERVGSIDEKTADKGEIVKVSKESKVNIGENTDLLFTVGYTIKDSTHIDLSLDLASKCALPQGLPVGKMADCISEINGILYDAFTYLVSDNVIGIMKGGEPDA